MTRRHMFISIFLLILASAGLARDVSHYPYDDYAYAGKYLRSFVNESTGAALALHVDFEFSDQQNTLLKRATATLAERYLAKPVLDCAYDSAVKDLPSSRESFIAQMKEAFGFKRVDEASVATYLFVARYRDDPSSVGIGFSNLYYDKDKPFPGYSDRHYFYLALNDDFLGNATYPYGTDSDYWAGVMAHEILHNLNFDHRSGHSGSFMTEYAKCLWNNGVQSNVPEGVFVDRTIDREM